MVSSLVPTSYSRGIQQKWKADFLKGKIVPTAAYHRITEQQRDVLAKILQGESASLLSRPIDCRLLPAPAVNSVAMGRCIYTFTLPEVGKLYECGCTNYDRKMANSQRFHFETDVINQVLTLASQGKTEIKIAILAPGFLFSDFSWLIRAIAQLKQNSWQGTIRLNLIDPRYKAGFEQARIKWEELTKEKNRYLLMGTIFATFAALAGAGSIASVVKRKYVLGGIAGGGGVALGAAAILFFNKAHAIGKQLEQFSQDVKLKDQLRTSEAIKTFLTGLAMFSPNTIEIKSYFFNSVESYQLKCMQDKFKHDLLVGSDLDEAKKDIPKLKARTQTTHAGTVVI